MNLLWFYGIKPMVYDILVFSKLREMEYLIQAMIALRIWVDLHIYTGYLNM